MNSGLFAARTRRTGKSAFTSGKSSAFTLIELLVVIAIIAILAAILFPVFAQAREKARQTSCLSNEKQIMVGVMMYDQDYEEIMPNWYYPSGTGAFHPWMDAINPYIKNTNIWMCPDETAQGGSNYSAIFGTLPAGITITATYVWTPYNPYAYYGGWGGADKFAGYIAQPSTDPGDCNVNYGMVCKGFNGVGSPATSAFLIEGAFAAYAPYTSTDGQSYPFGSAYSIGAYIMNTADGSGDPGWQQTPGAKHTLGGNVGFADGHAKYVKLLNFHGDKSVIRGASGGAYAGLPEDQFMQVGE